VVRITLGQLGQFRPMVFQIEGKSHQLFVKHAQNQSAIVQMERCFR
jgi:hypothetical protein